MEKTKKKKQPKMYLPKWLSNIIDVRKVDMQILIILLVIVGFGLIMVASSSYVRSFYDTYNNESGPDSYTYIRSQCFAALIGLIGMTVAANIDYHILRKFANWLLLGTGALLFVVKVAGIVAGGAQRWMSIGGFSFQPSEIAKFAIILSFSHYISRNYLHMKKLKIGVLPLFITLILIAGLVAWQPHLSGAIIIFAIGVILMFIGGVKFRYFAIPFAAGATLVAILVSIFPYMRSRIFDTWLNPFENASNEGYQVVQSLYAIGSGGVFGLGFGQSRQKHLYLPEAHNDYIFSIICEELGFIGALLVILLFALLIIRGFYIAMHSKDKFGALLVFGIISQIAIQAILNIGVVTNALPSTGISLPFFSFGGTSLVMLLCEMGVVLSVSKNCYMKKV